MAKIVFSERSLEGRVGEMSSLGLRRGYMTIGPIGTGSRRAASHIAASLMAQPVLPVVIDVRLGALYGILGE